MSVDVALVDAAAVEVALREVYDPCGQAWQRPISIWDLGLVRQVALDGEGRITVRVSLTTAFCVGLTTIMRAVETRLGQLPGVTEVTVDIDAETPWTPELMTAAGRAALAARRAADRARAMPAPTALPA